MNENTNYNLDQALHARLTRLSSVPVDTSRLDRRLREAIGAVQPQAEVHRFRSWRPLASALAAAVVVAAAMIGLFMFDATSKPVIAAPAAMASLHQTVTSGPPTYLAHNVEEANRLVVSEWANAPQLPAGQLGPIKGCCVHNIANRKVVCVMLDQEQSPVTLVVAYAKDVKAPSGQVIEREGRQFVYHRMGQVNMVMTVHAERYICVMSELPADKLVEIAASLQF